MPESVLRVQHAVAYHRIGDILERIFSLEREFLKRNVTAFEKRIFRFERGIADIDIAADESNAIVRFTKTFICFPPLNHSNFNFICKSSFLNDNLLYLLYIISYRNFKVNILISFQHFA